MYTVKNTWISEDKTWLSTDTWRRIEERKTIKSKILNTKSKIIQEQLQLEHSIKDKEIRQSTLHDKRAHVDNIAMEVETAVKRGETAPNDTAYNWCSCHSGYKLWQNLPPPALGARFTIFWPSQPCGPTGYLALLLIKVG